MGPNIDGWNTKLNFNQICGSFGSLLSFHLYSKEGYVCNPCSGNAQGVIWWELGDWKKVV